MPLWFEESGRAKVLGIVNQLIFVRNKLEIVLLDLCEVSYLCQYEGGGIKVSILI